MVKVGINGFGRIGRLAFRRIQDVEGLEVVAINDLTDSKMLAHLLKYDTTHGRFNGEIEVLDDAFKVNGKEVKVMSHPDPAEIPWGDLGVEVVLEATGFFASKEKAELHLKGGAKKVVITAPGGADIPTIVYNTNHEILTGDETVISGASCTTNCLAPLADAINKNFGIVEGLMSTIHAYTGDQNTLDAPHRKGDFRRARAAAENIIPNTTGAAKAVGQVLPELNGKLDGSAQRVPVKAGSITEFFTVLEKNVTVEEVNAAMKAAANESFGYNEDEIVSSDIVGMTYGSLFDATLTKVMDVDGKQLVKTAAWYDNEMSYTSQLVRTLEYFAKL
ncbi:MULTISPECIES: type I glyceraldehyde-3-phosphate dehydrogenase [Aerococcus]|uniref:type I glyceraldehyde-3-phosphate dehydrogenase n=1 Tax=Aerococcus urinae (strain CCUG 59500 / ACS-120-V-Col10a) TaxID=2976812 RepID=UPI000200EF10|nr:type I glyceraldehyde-3-phosphate dehydrogenase [Aerococcus sp. Group 1]AEA01201.1 glyceraldehyde-3-phosphate dehydrogenase, type I [Aerococcus sp. Group 1]MCY3030908.1 type I glyceraldehyde-3-phosphate dehydrogenase [Aerococcus sp. Group 1]MCY3055609.1 type I glyceraldehyde-3-phosphate dehydrogenase [Aerococcus sp. Group 1]MCY3057339.1 type I glyceraldehyde-3-phosphate dehydrogenase [Aerococcus sp. Group 1]MCY3061461.1 type I glyceraldehyde-3-phosphate dehydrogenase [Aerococcus sp. Group 1